MPDAVASHRLEPFGVLIVDGYPLLREALAERMRSMGAGTVHEAGSVVEAHARARASGPCDLAILDIGLPDGSGLELITHLRARGWTQIAVFADTGTYLSVNAAFKAGAQAFLLKSSTPQRFTEGITRVLDGGVYADPTVIPLLINDNQIPDINRAPRMLSHREVEVLQLVADGQSNKNIGQALHLSPMTVKSHLSRIGHKLGTGTRAQMIALALRARVIC
ncbi:MAG TPA: response regulator transcription factor [Pseudonocardia sp.]